MMDFGTANHLTLEDITYEWLQDCKDPAQLKRAIRLIEEDGNYFVDLKREIERKLADVGGSSAPDRGKDSLSSSEKQSQLDDLIKWKEEMDQKNAGDGPSKDPHVSGGKGTSRVNLGLKKSSIPDLDKKQAEAEKTKGNEAMTSGDVKEAIGYYTAAIKLDPTNAIYFANRAMAYLKIKDFKKAIDDANASIAADSKYTKGYYRRAKANEAIGNLYSAACDLAEITTIDSNNLEIAGELDKILAKLNPNEKRNFEIFKENLSLPEKGQSKSGPTPSEKKFMKIQIEQDDEDEDADQQELEKQLTSLTAEKVRICEMVKLGDFLNAIKEFEKLLLKINGLPFNPRTQFLQLTVFSNIAHCYKQSELEKPAIEFSGKVISALQPKVITNNITEPEVNLLIKALIRRGLAYEACEKLDLAYADFHFVLSIQPENGQARQCLSRLSKHVSLEVKSKLDHEKSQRLYATNPVVQKEPEPKKEEPVEAPREQKTPLIESTPKESELWVDCSEEQRQTISTLKGTGNEAFKNKQFSSAIDIYSKALTFLEPQTGLERALNFRNPEDRQMYIDLLSNRSLTYYYAGNFRKGFYDANSVLQLTPENLKVIYRRAINADKYAHELLEAAKNERDVDIRKDQLDQCAEKFCVAIKDYENLLKTDSQNGQLSTGLNGCRQSLETVSKMLDKSSKAQQLAHPQVSGQLAPPVNEASEEGEALDRATKISGPSKKLAMAIEEKTMSIAQSAIKTLLEDKSIPKTSSQFETDINSLKGNEQNTLVYLSRFEPKQLGELYKAKQFEFKTFSKILTSLTKARFELQLPDSEPVAVNFLLAFLQTSNYRLTLKMLLKKEKQQLRELIDSLAQAKDFHSSLTDLKKSLE